MTDKACRLEDMACNTDQQVEPRLGAYVNSCEVNSKADLSQLNRDQRNNRDARTEYKSKEKRRRNA
jgi:hypothetical protein